MYRFVQVFLLLVVLVTADQPMPAQAANLAADSNFTSPSCITAACHQATQATTDTRYLLDNYRMSRNPGNAIAFDLLGTLHLTYWSGFFATNPSSPAAVYYQSWTETNGWSEQQTVDDSYIDASDLNYGGKRMGGRHPSLGVDTDNTVWIAWHDHRNCGVPPPYNGINNIEIYCDKKLAKEGWFSHNDIRLTYTNAPQLGDNGYCPRIQADPLTNMKTVIWYDFNLDGWCSDIFMMTSNSAGVFDTSTSMLSRRLTSADGRQPTPPQTLKPAFNMPDIVITPDAQRYAIWSQDFGGSIGNGGTAPIYFAQLPEQPEQVNYTTIVPNNDGYWYPPKIKLSPSGDLWVVYTGIQGSSDRSVEVIWRCDGQTQFDAPIILKQGGKNVNPDMAIDDKGRLHVVWIEDNGYRNHLVRYLLYDPATGERLRETQLTAESGAWAGPCIVLNRDQLPYIVYCEGDSDNIGDHGDIWFTHGIPPLTAAQDWVLYE